MYLGKNNPKFDYKLNEVTLDKTEEEKDLGIFITSKLDWKPHINYAVNKANKQLGLIKLSFKYNNETTTKLLYKSLVRFHLEYMVQYYGIMLMMLFYVNLMLIYAMDYNTLH
jgi:hypothetical protein